MWKPKPQAKPETGYYQIELPPDLMLALGDLISGKKVPATAIGRIKTALLYARKFDLPIDRLEWGRVVRESRRQGISEVDVLWDMMGRHKEAA